MSRREKKEVVVLGVVGGGYGYNFLHGKDGEWAKDHKIPRSEHCVPVKGGKRFKGDSQTQKRCGNGTMGFSIRRRGQSDVHMEQGLDGQWKKKRGTLIRPRSARTTASRISRRIDGSACGLVSSGEIHDALRDPKVVRAHRELAWINNQPRRRMSRRERRERELRVSHLKLIINNP
ncbi:hypothetical protein LCGC14_0143130 [marine sediment metagenome]|uniref:Uncharacterized protein n=1 Tax=marine sediment metagenome TaxID=412755 RepID=A0A0F9XIM2_9ZZZZ